MFFEFIVVISLTVICVTGYIVYPYKEYWQYFLSALMVLTGVLFLTGVLLELGIIYF